MEKKYIHSGQLIVASNPTVIHTVLGSCVAVCLYDEKIQISGMNHYLLPLWNNQGLQSPKYGNIAIIKLIEGMVKEGSQIKNIIAKVFGGASQWDIGKNGSNEKLMVGKRNIKVAEDILKEYGIRIVANDVGGDRGRKITMDSKSGKIQLKYTIKSGE
jgi:chemotaxis protein CheD